MNTIQNIVYYCGFILVAASALLFGQCAREVNPTGGLRDSLPPLILRMKPENKTVNFANKKVILQFNEYISLKSVTDNLIISPPSDPKPEIKQNGKRLIIDFSKCELSDSTTYSLNFGNSITDLNEGNILTGFNYIFSTGPTIDSLHITGRVRDVQSGKQIEGSIAALYSDLTDSAPAKGLPNYLAKTDADGAFLFNTVKKGSYRLLVFDDANRDLIFNPQTESLAFYDSVLMPNAENSVRYDTISSRDTVVYHPEEGLDGHSDTMTIDSVIKVSETIFSPSPVALYFFQPKTNVQFIKSYERARREKLTLIFNQPLFDDTLYVTLRDSIFRDKSVMVDLSPDHDTATIWIKDTAVLSVDTVTFIVQYFRFDSLHQKFLHTDTLMPRYNIRKDKFKGFQSFKFAFSARNGSFIIPDGNIEIESSLPLKLIDSTRLRLYTTVDTVGMKNRQGLFYSLDTAQNEVIDEYQVVKFPKYTPDSSYKEQKIVQYRYVPNRFMIRFGLPIKDGTFTVKLTQLPDLQNWCVTEFRPEENALYGWITDPEVLKYISPQISVNYPLVSGEMTEQVILLRKGKPMKKRKSARTAKQSLFVSKQQQESHYIDEMLEVVLANPLSSIDTALMSLTLAGDTAMTKLPAVFTLNADSKRKILVAYSWEKNKSYILNISRGACIDIYGETNKEFLSSVKTQGSIRHKISTKVPHSFKQDSLYAEKFHVTADWDFEKKYRFVIADSAFVDLYGIFSDSTETDFGIMNPRDLCTLEIRMQNLEFPIILEVMDNEMKNVVYQRFSTDTGQVVFSFGFVKPAVYGFRIIEDRNGNKKWDTGNYFENIQPETIRFSKETVETKANKDHIFVWDLSKTEVDKETEKVPDLLKNKLDKNSNGKATTK